MKSCSARASLRAAVSGLFFFYVLGGVAVRAASEIPFRLAGGRFVVVPVRVDGHGPFEFLLDTGTDTTLLTPEVAARLALRPTSRVALATPAGARAVARAGVRSLSVGPKLLGGGVVLIDGLEELRALDSRLCGVVGQNFLGRLNYSLDYGRRLLVVEDGRDAPPAGERVPIAKEEGKMFVAATSRHGDAAALRLLVDTAAGGLVLFDSPSCRAALEIETPPGLLLKASTNAGSLAARPGQLKSLRVGGAKFTRLPVALIRVPQSAGPRREDGLLPTSLFRSIYFNNAEGYVVLNPRLP